MATPEGIYPFATQDGKPIPLDIIKGAAVIVLPFTAGGVSTCGLPDYAIVGVLLSKQACLVRLGDTPVPTSFSSGEAISDCVYVPDSGIITVSMIPGAQLTVTGITQAGTLYIQLIEQWAALGLTTQYSRK